MKSIKHVLNAVRISRIHKDLNVKDYLCKYALNIINGALGGKKPSVIMKFSYCLAIISGIFG